MPNRDDLFALTQRNEIDFILNEIETGKTFAKIALDASEPEKRQRNLTNARKAYQTAIERIQKAGFSPDMKSGFLEKLAGLQQRFEQLGEEI